MIFAPGVEISVEGGVEDVGDALAVGEIVWVGGAQGVASGKLGMC